MSKTFVRDTLGRFASRVKGRRVSRGLGGRKGRGGRDTNAASGGGKIGGLPATKAAKKAQTSAAEDAFDGRKIKK